MRRIEHTCPSGLSLVEWVGECTGCGACATGPNVGLARSWEMAHQRFGCGTGLALDESGQGWRPHPMARSGRREQVGSGPSRGAAAGAL
jgi:hypothetical protein